MTVTELICRCRALGIDLTANADGNLDWESDSDPPAEILKALAEHKGELWRILASHANAESLAPGPAKAEAEPANDVHSIGAHAGDHCPIFALIGATGHSVRVSSLDLLPEGTTYICREGDKAWTCYP